MQVARLAADAWGVLSVEELRDCGLNRESIRRRVRDGWLHRLYRGVYAVGHPSVSLQGRFLAAVKACGPDAVLSHYSAGALWRAVEWDGRHPEVTVFGSAKHAHEGIRIHRSVVCEAVDVRRHEGIPVTAPARTLVDLASLLDYRSLRSAVRRAQSLRLVNLHQLTRAMNRLGGRRGIENLRRIVATGPAPTRTVLEDVVLDLILQGRFAHPDVNAPLVIDGHRVIPDFRWPEQRLIIEADGVAWHDHKVAREDDAERQALLEAHGERVLRITWEQAVAHPRQTVERLAAAGAPRGAQR